MRTRRPTLPERLSHTGQKVAQAGVLTISFVFFVSMVHVDEQGQLATMWLTLSILYCAAMWALVRTTLYFFPRD